MTVTPSKISGCPGPGPFRPSSGGRGVIWVGLLAVLAMILAGPVHHFLAHGHGVSEAVPEAATASNCGHHGCGHGSHTAALPASKTPDPGTPTPCDGDGENCDLCTLLAGTSAAPTVADVDHPRPLPAGVVLLDRGTSRDVWGPSTASSRGPPLA